jgi:TPP-dependent pyruvate/acetoin dehydrogenase alpha subunit
VAQGFRPAEELEGWKARCPILRMRPLVTDEEDRAIRAAVTREIEEALAHARRAPWPEASWKPAYYEV